MLLVLSPLALLVLLSIPGDYKMALDPSNTAYDHALTNTALAIASRVYEQGGRIRVDLSGSVEAALLADRVDRIYFSVFGPDGGRLAGNTELKVGMDSEANPSYADGTVDGERVRQVTLLKWTVAGTVAVAVAETRRKREDTASSIAVAMMTPNVILIAVTVAIVYFGIHIALRPLELLGEEIGRRSAHEMKPLSLKNVSQETEPLVAAINSLISDLHAATAAQQVFLANAAHQLRTPLAALQTQLELAVQDVPEEYRSRIAGIRDATHRIGHLAHQLLSLARSGAEADLAHEHRQLDLGELLEEAASQFLDAALARRIDLGFETSAVAVHGSRWLLHELLANLVDNAIRYTPFGGHVTARCGVDHERQPFLEVEDDGPGIPVEDRKRIFERFYRAGGTGGIGAGLGLAIVREVADRHAAVIVVASASESSGTRFRVTFPPVA